MSVKRKRDDGKPSTRPNREIKVILTIDLAAILTIVVVAWTLLR